MDHDESLSDHFNRHFTAELVREQAQRQEVFRLRHDVYCEELGYEPLRDDAMEQDDCDAISMFALVRHRSTGRAAGCVRLIRHPPQQPDWRFPFERACGSGLHEGYIDAGVLRERATEVSRLAVHQDFRRRRGEHHTPEGGGSTTSDHDRQYPLIAMGLFLSASALTLEHDIRQSFVMMEPRLARLLGSCGLRFAQVGALVQYHGLRGPFRINQAEVQQNLRPEALALLRQLRQELR